ncbi:MAG: 50S ribosomal protein L17 [Brevinematales bacterium]
MRHGNRVKKLSRTTSHRRALVRNLATSLFKYERIITTVEKAKFIRPFAEKLITKAKTDTVASRRKVFETIRDEAVLNKLFVDIARRYVNRPGGYTRIIRLGYRSNDGAERAIIELVEEKLENVTAQNAK